MSEFTEIACAKQSRSREKINDSAKCRIIPVELKKEERGGDEWEGRNKEGERERAKYTWISSGLDLVAKQTVFFRFAFICGYYCGNESLFRDLSSATERL